MTSKGMENMTADEGRAIVKQILAEAEQIDEPVEILTLVNGNNQQYNIGLPKLVILGDKWNNTAINHVFEETGLVFRGDYNLEARPHSSQQIVKLLLTYNFKTQYHNNSTNYNTLFLKSDHHIGFQVESICFECCKKNHINTSGLTEGDRLSC